MNFSINGVPACANKELLTDIARKEWGFDGYIVSDASAISNIETQVCHFTRLLFTAIYSSQVVHRKFYFVQDMHD